MKSLKFQYTTSHLICAYHNTGSRLKYDYGKTADLFIDIETTIFTSFKHVGRQRQKTENTTLSIVGDCFQSGEQNVTAILASVEYKQPSFREVFSQRPACPRDVC